jgi:uncharacterized protein (DUF4213/DUF364 family)
LSASARARWRLLRPLGILIVVVTAVPWVVSLSGAADKRVTTHEVRSVNGGRALDLTYERDYQYEATFEKCEIQSLDTLAASMGVTATPEAVARVYASRHEASIRDVVYRGCRDAFTAKWAPPSSAAPAPPPPGALSR